MVKSQNLHLFLIIFIMSKHIFRFQIFIKIKITVFSLEKKRKGGEEGWGKRGVREYQGKEKRRKERERERKVKKKETLSPKRTLVSPSLSSSSFSFPLSSLLSLALPP